VRWRKWSDPYPYSTGMLIRILFVALICLNEAHEEVRKIAEEAMEELGKQNAKTQCEAEPRYLKTIDTCTFYLTICA
jgi:hypothetical protein